MLDSDFPARALPIPLSWLQEILFHLRDFRNHMTEVHYTCKSLHYSPQCCWGMFSSDSCIPSPSPPAHPPSPQPPPPPPPPAPPPCPPPSPPFPPSSLHSLPPSCFSPTDQGGFSNVFAAPESFGWCYPHPLPPFFPSPPPSPSSPPPPASQWSRARMPGAWCPSWGHSAASATALSPSVQLPFSLFSLVAAQIWGGIRSCLIEKRIWTILKNSDWYIKYNRHHHKFTWQRCDLVPRPAIYQGASRSPWIEYMGWVGLGDKRGNGSMILSRNHKM